MSMNLSTRIRIDKAFVESPNLTDRFSPADLDAIGAFVWEGYNRDKFSRVAWEKRTQAAMDLAMQLQKDKNFPWPGASNVAFPLVTIATLQFHSRAYPAIIQGSQIVNCRVNGPDPHGIEKARALRIGEHMSYQLLEENPSWEEQHDRLLINIPIVGCAFKKTYRSNIENYNKSDLVMAWDLVMDYYAKSVESCARKTHVISGVYRNDIYEGIMSGRYRDVRQEGWYQGQAPTPVTSPRQDARTGQNPPPADSDTPYTFLEQHCLLDLDGDGYKEPYIVTIEETSRCVVQIAARFDRLEDVVKNARGEVMTIRATEYFTKYGFIPSPDGGIYDIGFGTLLGPLNESVNSAINQLIDAGTMSNTAGGFLGRGAKIRGGVYTFAPMEWKRVDSTGDDLRKNIFPLPVREPSNVLFQLLSLLINYTNRISGSTDTMVGESTGQNTPAQTTQTMVEQGMKIYNAIFKRVWRSMKAEFRKLYILNGIFQPDATMFGPEGKKVLRDDYLGDPARITPYADQSISSDTARLQQAITIKQSAMATRGYNPDEVERNFLRALHVDGIDVMYPGVANLPPAQDPKLVIETQKAKVKIAQMQADQQRWVIEMTEERRVNNAKILQMEALAAKAAAEAGGVQAGHQIAAFEAAIGALKAHDDALRGRIELMIKAMESQSESTDESSPDGGGMGSVEDASGILDAATSTPPMAGGGQGGLGGGALPG